MAVVEFHQFFRQRQPDTGSFMRSAYGRIRLLKAVENAGQIGASDSYARIGDNYIHEFFLSGISHMDSHIYRPILGSELDRVCNQV